MPLKPMNSPTHLDNKHSHTLKATIRAILLLLRAILTMAILKVVHRDTVTSIHQVLSRDMKMTRCVCAHVFVLLQ